MRIGVICQVAVDSGELVGQAGRGQEELLAGGETAQFGDIFAMVV